MRVTSGASARLRSATRKIEEGVEGVPEKAEIAKLSLEINKWE